VALPVVALLPGVAFGQGQDDYLVGLDKRLEIRVHILGEVASPGEYRVPDNTTVLELVSKAGGPTEFANAGDVSIKRERADGTGSHIVNVDIKAYLTEEDAAPPPVLRPGDVVTVPRNNMHRWRTAFTMIRDLSVVASAYFLYLRTK
jgi:polysaccharide export outer membrane protein